MTTTMNIRAHGAEQVRALERALGFEQPSPEATRAAGAALIRALQDRAERRRAEFVRAAELRRPVLDQLLGAAGVREAMLPLREDQKKRAARKAAAARRPRVDRTLDSTFDAGTNFAIKTPPFDGGIAEGAGGSVDPGHGTFGLNVQAFGESKSCGVTIGSWFFTPNDNPFQRFAVTIHYDMDWSDHANGYVAHNDFSTVLTVYDGALPMVQAEVQPAWSNGVGWFDSSSGSESGAWTVAETFFKANAGHSYFCQVGLSASADSDSGTFGFADSTIHMNGYIQDMVLGGLG
ncbi:hypothetical protein P3T37_006618 [Kitasatospora sp. MAA4]|uniref:hypothetical protein n=1 Tax=Kitasatospora sp. MAA4 TaxID=3035093 RepID=UPI002473F1D6|nr:hypothetical protein [Kitasatospora sp. MAA4]MDH6137186.1 hypothetical protein [Kitasatospora sp. MAA4]